MLYVKRTEKNENDDMNNNNNKVTFFPLASFLFAHTYRKTFRPRWKTGSCLPTALIGLSIYCQHHHNNCPKRPLGVFSGAMRFTLLLAALSGRRSALCRTLPCASFSSLLDDLIDKVIFTSSIIMFPLSAPRKVTNIFSLPWLH